LEVVLASAIGVLLMAALYVAVDVQLRHAQAGRDVIEQSTVARSLLTRIAADISAHVGPVLPAKPATGSNSSGAAGIASSPSTSAPTTSGPTTGGSASSSSSSSATTTPTGIQFNLGVQGDANRLTLYIGRLPRDRELAPENASADGQPGISDLRRATYWLAGSTGTPLGLARQEFKRVTSDDETSSVPPDVPDEASYVIAEEVRGLTFSYFDGNTWQDSWDGTTPGADGTTPQGPPMLIAITIQIATPGAGTQGEQGWKSYRHVVSIPTANGLPQQNNSSNTSQ
jgi:hypothetical protein